MSIDKDTAPLYAPLFAAYRQLSARVDHIVSVARQASTTPSQEDAATEQAWQTAYALVFSAEVSHRAFDLSAALGQRLTYDDPDTSYREDVLAFHRALGEHVQQLAPFFE